MFMNFYIRQIKFAERYSEIKTLKRKFKIIK